ncbi:unannotated protein [freshwater metagenome]|uniref:Unannotated protein n=1 Tax=freshwater metagenome TaxID=449393 RepID=A0A6J7HF52_9ZZZZ
MILGSTRLRVRPRDAQIIVRRAAPARDDLADILAQGAVRAGFQPVVELGSGRVVGWEGLARGPRGSALERPDLLFDAAREAGRTEELDRLCQRTILRAAIAARLRAPAVLLMNVEPDTSGFLPLELRDLYAQAVSRMIVCVEITERALTSRPGTLLGHLADLRAMGVSIALDDVGTDPVTLAMTSLVDPDLIKLHMALVQQAPGPAVAEALHAVSAQAEQSGATILVEGVETAEQAQLGLGLGATLAQGWLYGKRRERLTPGLPPAHPPVRLTRRRDPRDRAPFDIAADGRTPRPADHALLAAMIRHLEERALTLGPTGMLIAALGGVRELTAERRAAYADLGRALAFCAIIGPGFSAEPVPGVRGAAVHSDDPAADEHAIAVVAPHFAAALVAHGRPGDGSLFDYVLTHDRERVVAVAAALAARVA